MNRMGIIGAMSALLLSGACGGNGSDEPEAAETTKPTAVSLADTCPKIQDALDAAFEGGDQTEATYQQFADDVSGLLANVDPKGESLLDELWTASKYSVSVRKAGSSGSQLLEADGDWLRVMKRVTDTCQQLGAPLR